MDGDHVGSGFTHRTPADEVLQSVPGDEGHAARHRLIGGQPVGVVVSGGVATGAVGVTEQEGHGGKTRETATQRAQVLSVSSVVPVDEEQRVSAVHISGSCRAFWDEELLAVSGEQEAVMLWRFSDGAGPTSNTLSPDGTPKTCDTF